MGTEQVSEKLTFSSTKIQLTIQDFSAFIHLESFVPYKSSATKCSLSAAIYLVQSCG
jgi:hypothetical protein